MNSFQAYVNAIGESIANKDGLRLRQLIALDAAPVQQALAGGDKTFLSTSAVARIPEDWREFITLYLEMISSFFVAKKMCDAYEKAVAGLPSFMRAFREDSDAWVVFPMHSIVHNLRIVADAADFELKNAGKKPEKLADAADQLRKCFSVSLQAPGNKEKKMAALDVVNVSIKIYFKLHTLRLCKNLIRTVESRQFADLELFPASQRVTYMFYKGRLAVFDEKYEEAEMSLSYALRYCHKRATSNIARIIKYLLPVQLLLGSIPSQSLLNQYGASVSHYVPLIESLKSGSVALFNQSMIEKQFTFISEGTYLLLEKLRLSVYRRLFKKVAGVHAQLESAKASHIPLSLFAKALEIQGITMHMDEVECIVANLIFRKYVRGYMSHQHKVVVVAKNGPFPPLHSVIITE